MSQQQPQQPTPGNGVAVTAQPKVPVSLDGPIGDLDQAWRYASILAQSDLVPPDLRNKPANCFLIMLYGQQLKLPTVIAMQTIKVINGTPVMLGKLLLAKVREAGHRATIVEHTSTTCTVHIMRGDTGEEHSETFTLEDAVDAKLVQLKDGKPYARSSQGKPLPWENHTKRMLLWRAAGYCVDFLCPEVRMGFAIEGELDSERPSRPNLAQAAAQREDREAPARRAAGDVAAEVAGIAAEYAAMAPEPVAAADEPQNAEIVPDPVSNVDLRPLHAILTSAGITDREHKLRVVRAVTGDRTIESTKQLSKDAAAAVVTQLRRVVNNVADGASAMDAIDWYASHLEEQLGWST